MAQKTYAGIAVDVNEEGYFITPSQWTREIATEIAIAPPTARITKFVAIQ